MTGNCSTATMLDEIMNETYIRKADCAFETVMGRTYYVFARSDGTSFVSMISPSEWDMERFRLTYICDVVQDPGGGWRQV